MSAAPSASLGAQLADDAPTDGVSSLAWLDRDTLASGNWDSSVRLFHASSIQLNTRSR